MHQNPDLKEKKMLLDFKSQKKLLHFFTNKTQDVWHYEDINATKTWHQLPFWDGRIYS